MRNWTVATTKDTHRLKIYRYGLRNRIIQPAVGVIDFVDGVLLRHALCGSGLPEWAFKIPTGRPRYDEDGYLENSVGGALYQSFSALLVWAWDQEEKDLTLELPLTEEQAALLLPDSFDEEESEDQ